MKAYQLIALTAPEYQGAAEALWISTLLRLGLRRVHIRKPGASQSELRTLLEAIPQELRRRCVLSEYPELVAAYGLGGLHLSVRSWRLLSERPSLQAWQTLGVSCHSAQELASLSFVPDYAYLSPVADSLSKVGYAGGSWSDEELRCLCEATPFPLVALGGVGAHNAASLLRLGFDAMAGLGYWQTEDLAELQPRLERICQPCLLLCGGLDPTSEAGLTADVRYAERLGAKCYSICTALTVQHAGQFYGMQAIDQQLIEAQLDALAELAPPEVVKLGLVASAQQLLQLCRSLRQRYPQSLILWDPILRTSTGYQLLEDLDRHVLKELLQLVDYVLPNLYERSKLLEDFAVADAARCWHSTWVCKSEDSTTTEIIDVAYTPEGGRCYSSYPRVGRDRHGTGCLYASALAVQLARGVGCEEAMRFAQRAVARYRSGYSLECQTKRPTLGRRMFITHGATLEAVLEQTQQVLYAGRADMVQLRMKDAPRTLLLITARALLVLCRSYAVPLIINDHPDIAYIVGADGVHLGKEDAAPEEARRLLGDEVLIGCTCNTQADLERALDLPIDYVGLGPYRFTRTKQRLAPVLGLEGYRRLALQRYPLPVYAVGSVVPADEAELQALGVYGLAMSSALLERAALDTTPVE